MPSSVLFQQIQKRVNELSQDSSSIIVLKGIPIDTVAPECVENIDYDRIGSNKLGYFLDNVYNKRRFITYEEYLLLYEFVLSQYATAYILTNNIYMDQYPLDMFYSSDTRDGLITHFMDVDDNGNDDRTIGNIQEFVDLYVGLKEFNGFVIGTYCDKSSAASIKEVRINLFDETDSTPQSVDQADEYIDLVEEADYISLVKRVFSEPPEVFVRTCNYTGDVNKLNNHIRILAQNWSDWSDFFIVRAPKIEESTEIRPEYAEILSRYWGHSSFRNINVYDMAKLEEGEKEVVSVSQANVISALVQQVERCENQGVDFRDVFVTAPTGAGKSVMFQVPAIYLAEKYNLLTIVISPLIGLMNDQVKNLELRNYAYAKTINSDISPVVKQEIMEKVADSQYHILYISPETLLSRSDIEQLIGKRTVGMIVIDEAHIVTTWGKQFRPDYWYLGDHIKKIRKNQLEKQGRSFVIATFTATAVYHGIEDMYTETINSLHMLNPITYLGYVKRNDIEIVVNHKEKKRETRSEYEYDKFQYIEKLVKRAMITGKKTLIYFPTVALINRCYDYFLSRQMGASIAIYHGSMNKDKKDESYEKFLAKEKLVMFATKAFGMGIDINDIEIVAHFAPTGTVCDYVQEIGRAARREDLIGEANYLYDSGDFKHINRLHGLSMIQKYQLVEVIKKIDELYTNNLNDGGRNVFTRKRNAMLLDAENFAYIFYSPVGDEDNNINKVKTALLIIQKDFEGKFGFSPITVRPIPMFSIGFFEVDTQTQKRLLQKFPDCLEEIEPIRHICKIDLTEIWKKDPECASSSFPQFKYLLYSKDSEFTFAQRYPMNAALCVTIEYLPESNSIFEQMWAVLRAYINRKVLSGEHVAEEDIANELVQHCSSVSKYKARAICKVILSSMDTYRRNFTRETTPIAQEHPMKDGHVKYQFNIAVNSYFAWVERNFKLIQRETKGRELYLVNDSGISTKEISTVLGILEAMDVLSFKMIGGANSQLYIYVNQIRSLKDILNNPHRYKNRLLDMVSERHLISVNMLTYLYESGFSTEQMWDLLEDYFLGVIPEKVKHECLKANPGMSFE